MRRFAAGVLATIAYAAWRRRRDRQSTADMLALTGRAIREANRIMTDPED